MKRSIEEEEVVEGSFDVVKGFEIRDPRG